MVAEETRADAVLLLAPAAVHPLRKATVETEVVTPTGASRLVGPSLAVTTKGLQFWWVAVVAATAVAVCRWPSGTMR